MVSITYKKAGVDYSAIDPVKVYAQKAAKSTAKNLAHHNLAEVQASRGESAYVIDCGNHYLASIVECLGTKVLVADAVYQNTGRLHYSAIAQDTVAMAVNDIITMGARPVSIHAYWAAGDSKWFQDEARIKDLVKGWKRACNQSDASWGGGETPALGNVVHSSTVDLAASCVGVIRPRKNLITGEKLDAGDIIILLASSGIHANGLSLARKLAKQLSDGYKTKISKHITYGQALLRPTIIYSAIVQDLFRENVDIHYMSNITGHGWRKIMRHPANFTYRIKKVLPIPNVLKFIVKECSLSHADAYGSLNMGAGFAIFVARKDAKKILAIARRNKIKAYIVGEIEKGSKQVVIEPLGIVYRADSLQVRG